MFSAREKAGQIVVDGLSFTAGILSSLQLHPDKHNKIPLIHVN